MEINHYIIKARRMPPHIIIRKGIGLLLRKSQDIAYRLRDRCSTTYSPPTGYRLSANPIELLPGTLAAHRETILNLANLYLAHYFDLLGSGWTEVNYGLQAGGLEDCRYNMSQQINPDSAGQWLSGRISPANFETSKAIWRLVDKEYKPLDWQVDFKSGYRWSEAVWYHDIKYGDCRGADVKVPWELARSQHLPMLAWAYNVSRHVDKDMAAAMTYAREFENQIMDFIALNPPRYGVNWCCTMDVGIRVTNWLMGYDLFKAAGVEFDTQFEQVLAQSVYEHGLHIIHHLEYSPELRSNHYLSDIAGLLFVAVHLPADRVADRWLAFAVQELISEMHDEFQPDGSNFEASTSYHRLSAEIMFYCAALCLGLPPGRKQALSHYVTAGHDVQPRLKEPLEQFYNVQDPQLFSDWFWERLEKAAEFTLHIMKPCGAIPQFGDNDSGRFLKIWPACDKTTTAQMVAKYKNLEHYRGLSDDSVYYDENILDHRHLLAVAGALFGRQDFLEAAGEVSPEAILVQKMLQGKTVTSYHRKRKLTQSAACRQIDSSSKSLEQWKNDLVAGYGPPLVTIFPAEGGRSDLLEDLRLFCYPDFGLCVYKSKALYLVIRCGSVGQNGNGGHAHNDQLAIELTIDGQDIIRDPGTYLYTPLPERRNVFRSTTAHFTPQMATREQNGWLPGANGLFSMTEKAGYGTVYMEHDGFVGYHDGFGIEVYRLLELTRYSIQILDYCSQEIRLDSGFKEYSCGYGKCQIEK